MSNESHKILQEKLAYLEKEKAISSSATQRFELGKRIEETKEELGIPFTSSAEEVSENTEKSHSSSPPPQKKSNNKFYYLLIAIVLSGGGGYQVYTASGFSTSTKVKPTPVVYNISSKYAIKGNLIYQGKPLKNCAIKINGESGNLTGADGGFKVLGVTVKSSDTDLVFKIKPEKADSFIAFNVQRERFSVDTLHNVMEIEQNDLDVPVTLSFKKEEPKTTKSTTTSKVVQTASVQPKISKNQTFANNDELSRLKKRLIGYLNNFSYDTIFYEISKLDNRFSYTKSDLTQLRLELRRGVYKQDVLYPERVKDFINSIKYN